MQKGAEAAVAGKNKTGGLMDVLTGMSSEQLATGGSMQPSPKELVCS